MRTLRFLLQKEFRQIFRDPSILRIIFMMPIIQLIILPMAADYEMKNINLVVTDHDHSAYSRQLIHKITASGYFKLAAVNNSYQQSLRDIEADKADLVLEIPVAFEKKLIRENAAGTFIAVNAINGTKGNLGAAYIRTILQDYNQEIRSKLLPFSGMAPQPQIAITYANWFNPQMNYKFFMVPGILVLLLTMVGANLTAINIVREKEIGTIEQINVTPIRKHHFILGKLIPFWILGLIVMTLGFVVARVVYGISPSGSFLTIYAFAAVYLLAVLGLGLLVSTYSNTQQQAMLISFFIMMIFVLMGGLYTSISSMPEWAQLDHQTEPCELFY